MLGLRRFRSLVRGVSNHGAAPSFETGATRRLRFSGSTYLRPSQDEADKWPAPSRFISSGNRFS